jgi:hypothetical protein
MLPPPVLFLRIMDNSILELNKEKEPECKCHPILLETPRDSKNQFASGIGPHLLILREQKGFDIDFRFPSKKDGDGVN